MDMVAVIIKTPSRLYCPEVRFQSGTFSFCTDESYHMIGGMLTHLLRRLKDKGEVSEILTVSCMINSSELGLCRRC
jgi:hypothetical protein